MSTISGNECWYFIDLNLNHTFFDETKKEIHQMWGSKNRLKFKMCLSIGVKENLMIFYSLQAA